MMSQKGGDSCVLAQTYQFAEGPREQNNKRKTGVRDGLKQKNDASVIGGERGKNREKGKRQNFLRA